MKPISFDATFTYKVVTLFALAGAVALAVPLNHIPIGLLAPLHSHLSGIYVNPESLPKYLLDMSSQ